MGVDELAVLLLQLRVADLGGVGFLCGGERPSVAAARAATPPQALQGSAGHLLSASAQSRCDLSLSCFTLCSLSSSSRSCSLSTSAFCFCLRCSSTSPSRLFTCALSWVM